jgi:glutathione S-transferase
MRLYFFAGSCAAQTTRLELEYKGLAHELVYLLPVAHGFILGIRGFPRQSVPALEIDRPKLSGTRVISRALDELQPEPALFPADPERRAAVEEAERWGEDLQDAGGRGPAGRGGARTCRTQRGGSSTALRGGGPRPGAR